MIRSSQDMTVEQKPNMRGGDGTVTQRNLLNAPEELGGKGRLFARMTLPPGGSIGGHQHTGEWEVYYILSGSGTYDDNGTIVPFQAGDVMQTPKDGTHSIQNTGSEPVDFIALILYE